MIVPAPRHVGAGKVSAADGCPHDLEGDLPGPWEVIGIGKGIPDLREQIEAVRPFRECRQVAAHFLLDLLRWTPGTVHGRNEQPVRVVVPRCEGLAIGSDRVLMLPEPGLEIATLQPEDPRL